MRRSRSAANIELAREDFVGEDKKVELTEGIDIEELKVEEITEGDNMGNQCRTMAEYTRPTLDSTSSDP